MRAEHTEPQVSDIKRTAAANAIKLRFLSNMKSTHPVLNGVGTFGNLFAVTTFEKQVIEKASQNTKNEFYHSFALYDAVRTISPRSLLAIPAQSKTAAKTNTGSNTDSPYSFLA